MLIYISSVFFWEDRLAGFWVLSKLQKKVQDSYRKIVAGRPKLTRKGISIEEHRLGARVLQKGLSNQVLCSCSYLRRQLLRTGRLHSTP